MDCCDKTTSGLERLRELLVIRGIIAAFEDEQRQRGDEFRREMALAYMRGENDHRRQCGAWDEDELADDSENRRRLVWVLGCNAAEEMRHD